MDMNGLKINFLGDSITHGQCASKPELCYVSLFQKKYPDAVTIEIRECRESYNIFFDNGILLTSSSGKIIANSAEAAEALPVVYGFNPTVLTPGKQVESSDSTKNEIFQTFTKIMK